MEKCIVCFRIDRKPITVTKFDKYILMSTCFVDNPSIPYSNKGNFYFTIRRCSICK